MRTYKMTKEQLEKIMAACSPISYVVPSGTKHSAQQKSINCAWEELGKELGFKYMTVKMSGKYDRLFSAEPIENVKKCKLCGIIPEVEHDAYGPYIIDHICEAQIYICEKPKKVVDIWNKLNG